LRQHIFIPVEGGAKMKERKGSVKKKKNGGKQYLSKTISLQRTRAEAGAEDKSLDN